MNPVVRLLYALLLGLLHWPMQWRLAWRGRSEPLYLHQRRERLGTYDSPAPEPGCIWVHAVSLGETRTAAVLVQQLRRVWPGMRLLLSHGTATGRAQGQSLLQTGDNQAWLPWDSAQAVERFLAHYRPALGLLMETEVWPNLVAGCRAHQVPLVLVNARLSAKSLRAAQWLGALARPTYASLTAVYAQTQEDAQRLRQLGAPVAAVLGNLKFDATPDAAQIERGRAWRAQVRLPVVLLASSREGEEQTFLTLVQQYLRARAVSGADESGAVQWLIVPRHPQRFDEVAALVKQHGLSLSRRSQWADAPQAAQVWLGDSLGEMALYYGMADVALLGGSFEPLGGQNLIEAAACGCPVVMGPHTFNFAQAAQSAIEAGAALRAATMHEALQQTLAVLSDTPQRSAMQAAALAFSAAHTGAAQRTAQALTTVRGTTFATRP